jgi:glycosyltransferase involved in cell wall biosynthesis
MLILGVDAGYANLAYCMIDSEDHKNPSTWDVVRVMEGHFTEQKFFHVIYRWVTSETMRELFQKADRIVLERQMSTKFAAINVVIRTLYYDKTIEYNPQTIGAFYKFPRDRYSKKRATIEYVGLIAQIPDRKKKDDLADAYLLALYDLQFHFGVLTEGSSDVIQSPGDRRGNGRKRRRYSISPAVPAPAPARGGIILDLTGSSSEE